MINATDSLDKQAAAQQEEFERQQEELQRQQQSQRSAQNQQAQGGLPGMSAASFMGEGSAGGAAAGGGTAAGGSSSSSSAGMGAGGWWAVLAAVIAANEHEASEQGARNENKGQQAVDSLTGRVVEQDMSKRWIPKIQDDLLGDEDDKFGAGEAARSAADFSTLDFSNGFDNMKDAAKKFGAFLGIK